MTKKEAKERIEKLKKEINYHRYLYHVLDRQEISDPALDSLKYELQKLEEQSPEFITSDSPTQRVGGEPLGKFKKVKHKVRMLSLIDAFDNQEIKDWEKRIRKLLPLKEKLDYYGEIKMDGLAIALIYKNGIFYKGATRGDGTTGEDITENLKTIEAIPLKLETIKIEKEVEKFIEKALKTEIEVRGEIFMSLKNFEEINKEQEKKGLEKFANPRNVAAGSIRQLDPKIAASRKLDFYAYDFVTNLGQKTHQEGHFLAKSLGIKVNPYNRYCKDIEEVIAFHDHVGKIRKNLPYWTDGIVVNVNNRETFRKLGVVGKAPRAAIAFKYPGEQVTTVVEDIKVQIGRTGALTPVAYLKSVHVAGSTISRATLHNEDEIKRLDVRIGDTVIIQKAGDVIPDVVRILPNLRTGKERIFKMPNRCPVCGAKIIKKPDEVVSYCSNKNCFAQRMEKLYHFVSKKSFNIEGLGPKILDQLVENNLIKDAADLFRFKKEDLIELERFGEKSSENIIGVIDKSRKISLAKLIFSLGIRHVGEETAIGLVNYFQDLEELKKASLEELRKIEEIGEVVAESIYQWFRDKENLKFLEKLSKYIEIEKPKVKKELKLKGLSFVLTGVLKTITREEAKSKIRELGGDISSSISKNIDYIIVGEEPGSKYEKAKKLGLKILSEEEFLKMIK